MTRVDIAEAKARLSEFIDRALAGEEVIIARSDVPVIRLVPESAAATQGLLGLYRNHIVLGPDFDASLPDFADLGG